MKKTSIIIYASVFLAILVVNIIVVFFTYDNFTYKQFEYTFGYDSGEVYTIYIGGAVEHEGYYEFTAGTTYQELLLKAQPLKDAITNYDYFEEIDTSKRNLYLNNLYYGKIVFVINVNSRSFEKVAVEQKIDRQIIDLILDYLARYNKFDNKQQLIELLGEFSYLKGRFYIGDAL
ncbi:MAG: hypothetical protein RR248_04450 [Clostridia bacterium]